MGVADFGHSIPCILSSSPKVPQDPIEADRPIKDGPAQHQIDQEYITVDFAVDYRIDK